MVAILTDFAIAGALILVSQMLRAKIKFLQSFFIPASLLAGLIALILGNQVLGVLNFSDYSGDYTWTLVVMSFVAVGLPGIKFTKASGERIAATSSISWAPGRCSSAFPSFSAAWFSPKSIWASMTASVC